MRESRLSRRRFGPLQEPVDGLEVLALVCHVLLPAALAGHPTRAWPTVRTGPRAGRAAALP